MLISPCDPLWQVEIERGSRRRARNMGEGAARAALGSAGSPESRYFIKPNPDNWTGYKFLTTSDLMQSWKDDFGKQYNISAATMAHVVTDKGKDSTVEAHPPAGVHYNLTMGARHDQG